MRISAIAVLFALSLNPVASFAKKPVAPTLNPAAAVAIVANPDNFDDEVVEAAKLVLIAAAKSSVREKCELPDAPANVAACLADPTNKKIQRRTRVACIKKVGGMKGGELELATDAAKLLLRGAKVKAPKGGWGTEIKTGTYAGGIISCLVAPLKVADADPGFTVADRKQCCLGAHADAVVCDEAVKLMKAASDED
ncbi:MAG: hypothetical protein HOE53_04850, partial [Candidatus Magasanikbacteria bacterium]|nr:hypothetical protein [Candidatus Magasanikbacteria bacterium]